MSDDVNIRISATDNATATLRQIQGELGKFSASVKGLASFAIAGYGVQQVGSFLAGTLKEYAEAEKSQAKLQSVLKATGNTTKLTFAEINEFTDQLEKSTGTSGESLNDAAANLSRFRNITGDSFKEVLTLANDMSKVLGTDVTGNVQLLAKALNSPAEGLSRLSRLGISFNEVQKQQIEMLDQVGDKAEAQAKILDEIRRQFGGAGADYGKTTAGQLEILSANIGDLKEAIGETLAGAILPLIQQINGTNSSAVSGNLIQSAVVQSQENKVAEKAALEKQIAVLDAQLRRVQEESRKSAGGLNVSGGFFGNFTAAGAFGQQLGSGENQIADLRRRQAALMRQLESITQEAQLQSAQEAIASIVAGAVAQSFGSIAENAGGATAGFMSGRFAQIAAEDAGSAVGRQLRGIIGGQDWNGQQRDPSLQATESRFLTRGRGQLSPEAKKQAEDNAKQLAELKAIRDVLKNLGENMLVVEGIA
jgi:hypothetical protein